MVHITIDLSVILDNRTQKLKIVDITIDQAMLCFVLSKFFYQYSGRFDHRRQHQTSTAPTNQVVKL